MQLIWNRINQMGKILNENEAAFKLGITKELLFAYVRYAPKKCLGHNRKLISEIKDGQNFFDEEELERFDTYLKEPWSIPDAPRPEIPKYIQDYLKVEVGGKCPISGKGYPLENAHITPYTECRNHYHHNLIRISKEEHTKIDTGVIDRDILQKIKQALINKIRQKLFEKEKQDAFTKDIPLPHPLYVGKFHKLLELTSTMETEKFIVIEGLGGIGKTQLVLNAIDNVKYHNPVIWIEIESKHSLDELCIELTNKITPFVNSNVENIISSLRNLQITIILDSIENLLIYEKESTEEFLETLLTQTQNVQLIITSQIDLSSIDYPKTIIFPEPLDRNWGIELFKSLLEEQIDVSDSDFDWLIKFCSGHPLAIKLVVSLLKFYKSSKQTIKRIKEVGNIELPQKKVHNKKTSFDICLATVYESLTDNQVKILQYCKYFPAGVNQDLLKDTVRVDNYDEDVASLKNLFMIESQEDIFFEFERLIIPSSIRPFLRTKSSNMSPQKELIIQKDIITYLMMEAVIIDTKYIERQEYGSATAGIARMESELPNLMEAMRLAKKNLIYFKTENNKKELLDYLFFIAAISASLGKYCFTRGHYDYGIFFSKIGLDANRELGKEQEISMQYMYLTQIQSRQFDIEGFSQTIKEFLEFAETTDNLIVKANASWAKARFEFDKSLYVESLASYDKTLEIMSHIYQEQEAEQDSDEFDSEQHEGNIAIIKFERAKVFEFTGKYEEAIAQYMDAIKIFEKLNDEINLTSYYHHIAHCLCKIDNFEEGINYYSKAIQGFIDFGQMDYLINSVTDIGRFIEKRPEIVNLEILDEQLLSSTIDRIIYQLKNVITRELKLNKSLDFILKEIPFNLIGNMVLLIQVIGLSFHRFLLTESLDDFAHEIGIKKMKFELFPAIVNLGHAIGGVDEWKTNKEIKQAVINSILQSCLIINGGPDLQSKSRIFYWLAIWVQVTGLEKEATAENLFKQAWDSLPEL
tara:strand:+ start:6773 stop:9712 length:2940 start_codon:yes stop_codon:yes gene_type:complete